ncbi:TPA: DUF4277 domain-containing protein [Legionella pneumophila subsp. pneumophila]|nr:DUF4277 domain-containing protein [Legionella pneumophila subsp. pneumophila]HAT9649721.1 DUF4277 domain-containing protein [Legionella pneumophila subsp. pneumophila]HAT9918975.1 DUF4277 domain-containing protein [Legionella pneumophila subsp. pneumophila]
MAFCKEIGLESWGNKHFPKESHNSHISNGQLFVAMLLNRLGFVSPTRMYTLNISRTSPQNAYWGRVFYPSILMMMS